MFRNVTFTIWSSNFDIRFTNQFQYQKRTASFIWRLDNWQENFKKSCKPKHIATVIIKQLFGVVLLQLWIIFLVRTMCKIDLGSYSKVINCNVIVCSAKSVTGQILETFELPTPPAIQCLKQWIKTYFRILHNIQPLFPFSFVSASTCYMPYCLSVQ